MLNLKVSSDQYIDKDIHVHKSGVRGVDPPWPPQAGFELGESNFFQRKITKKGDFTLHLHDPPETIMYLDEKFLWKMH